MTVDEQEEIKDDMWKAYLGGSRKYMYEEVLKLQKEGKLSSTNAKKLIKDILKEIYAGEFRPPKEYVVAELKKYWG